MEWLIYLSKVSACMALFYTFYHFYLQKLTFFSINRAYLLFTLMLSFLIPTLQFEVERPALKAVTTTELMIPVVGSQQYLAETSGLQAAAPAAETIQFDWQTIISAIYWTTAGTTLLLFFIRLTKLIWYARRVSRRSGRLKIIEQPRGLTNCSFLNYVFIDCHITADEAAAILKHENVHASQLHSLDKLLIAVCKSLLWFNPFIYLYGKALEQVHEYEADQATAVLFGNTNYADLLLSMNISQQQGPQLVHSFVKSPLKERIKMLFTNPSTNMKKLTYLTLVPAGLALIWLFSVQVVYAESKVNFLEPLKDQRQVEERTLLPGPAKMAEGKGPLGEKQALPEIKEEPEAPLRLIDNVELGENPLVFIDGREYPAEILTRISPVCMSSAKFSYGKAEISTWKNQIMYATDAEIETAKVRRETKAKGNFYSRYPVTINGHKRDEVLVRFGSSFTEAAFPVGYKIALFMDGKIFSEKDALKMSGNPAYNMSGIDYRYAKDEPELFGKYGSQYDLILKFERDDASAKKTIPGLTRGSSTVISESGDEKFEYRATDSIAYSSDKRYITLFGNARIINGKRSTLSGDKIRFDSKTRTAVAQNASFTFEGQKNAFKAVFAKIDIDKATYELLSGTPDF